MSQIAPLQSTIIYNINNNSINNDSGSICGINKKSQRSYRSKNDFHVSTEQQNKEYNSKNKVILENTQNDIRSDENFDNSMKPLRIISEQGYRDSSFLHNRSMNVCDQSNLYTAGDISLNHDQSNILPIHIRKNESSLILGDLNQGITTYVNNILDFNESSNPRRYQTCEKNSTIDNNTLQLPNSAENRYIQDSKDRLQAIQTRNIQQQIAMKQKRDQILNKKIEEGNRKRNKSDEGRLSISQNNGVYIANQKKCTIDENKADLNNSIDVENRKISFSVSNFSENKNKKENNFTNQLHKETSINNLNYQNQQLQQMNYTNSLSFLHNQTQHEGTMILQQQQKDLSIFFNNISDNYNSVQNNHTSPENKKMMKKKILSPIPPTDFKEIESINNDESCKMKKRAFETDCEGEEGQNYNFNIMKVQKQNNQNIINQYYNVQQIKGFDLNLSEQSYSNYPSKQQSEVKQYINNNQSILNNIEISENSLQIKSNSNGKLIKSIIEQNKNKENDSNMRSLDIDNQQIQGKSQISNSGSRKNSKQQLNVPLKNLVKNNGWEKFSNCSPYLESLPSMLSNQKDELKQKEKDLKSKMEKNKQNRKGSKEINDKLKGVIDLYGFEVQQNDQRNILVSKKSSRSIKSQDSKRSIDNGDKEYIYKAQQHQKLPLQDTPKNNLSQYQTNQQSDQSNTNIIDTSFGNQKKLNIYQMIKSKKPPISSQNTIQFKNIMYKENKQDYPNSARVNLHSLALRQTTTYDGNDMSTLENNMITQSNNNDGFFDRNQDFAIKRPNNQQSIQFDIANSDRQNNRFSFNDEFNF